MEDTRVIDCKEVVLNISPERREDVIKTIVSVALDNAKEMVGYNPPTEKRNRAGKRLKGWQRGN